MRLGQNEMVNMIMKMIHQQHFRSKNSLIRTYQEQLWRHSVSCASGSLWTALETLLDSRTGMAPP